MSVFEDIETEFRHFNIEEERIKEETIQEWRDDPEITGDEMEWLRFAHDHGTERAWELFQEKVRERVETLSLLQRIDLLKGFIAGLEDELEDDFVEKRAGWAAEKLVVLDVLKPLVK